MIREIAIGFWIGFWQAAALFCRCVSHGFAMIAAGCAALSGKKEAGE